MVLVFFGLVAKADDKTTNDTLIFKVSGNCEMCKERIEYALDVKGVSSADWNVETKMITVVYNPKKITEDKIHELISKAGYETEKKEADAGAYDKLPGCCQYDKTQHPKKQEKKP